MLDINNMVRTLLFYCVEDVEHPICFSYMRNLTDGLCFLCTGMISGDKFRIWPLTQWIYNYCFLIVSPPGAEQPWRPSVAGGERQNQTWLKPKGVSAAGGWVPQQEVLMFATAVAENVPVGPQAVLCLSMWPLVTADVDSLCCTEMWKKRGWKQDTIKPWCYASADYFSKNLHKCHRTVACLAHTLCYVLAFICVHWS